jgi:hypothetical protein
MLATVVCNNQEWKRRQAPCLTDTAGAHGGFTTGIAFEFQERESEGHDDDHVSGAGFLGGVTRCVVCVCVCLNRCAMG